MLNPNFTPFPVLNTRNLILRELADSDINEVFILRSDERVMKYINRPPAKVMEEAAEFIKKINSFVQSNESIMWGISFKNDARLIGNICLWNIKCEDHRAEIGFSLLPEYHGKKIMHEAVEAVINFGFNDLKLHSIEATVNPANIASIKLLERNNFKREAYFRENYFYEGEFLDTAIYGLLASNDQ